MSYEFDKVIIDANDCPNDKLIVNLIWKAMLFSWSVMFGKDRKIYFNSHITKFV